MKLWLRVFLFLVIIHVILCAKFKFTKKDNILKSVVRKLISGNKFTGFLVVDLFAREKNPDVLKKSRELLRHISSSQSTLAIIDFHFGNNIVKFTRNVTRFCYREKLLENPLMPANVVASDNVASIVLINSHLDYVNEKLLYNIRYINYQFSSVYGEFLRRCW